MIIKVNDNDKNKKFHDFIYDEYKDLLSEVARTKIHL